MNLVQTLRELGQTKAAAPLKQAVKRTIDLVDGTTFRARPAPSPEGAISSFYERYGYAILRGVIESANIDALLAALDSEVVASHGAFLRHKSCRHEPNIFLAGTNIPVDGLLNPHAQTETPRTAAAIESLLLSERIADLLTNIDGAQNYTVHQTIVFFMPPGTGLHLDGWSFDTDPRGFGHTLWIPFEPVTLRNGPLAIVPWPRGKIVSPSELNVQPASAEAYESYHAALAAYIRREAPDCVVPQLDPGDLVVFASTTPHGTLPFDQPSRRAMQVIARPSNLRWGSWPQFEAGLDHSPNGPWGALKSVGKSWRIVCQTTI
jgi:ectoine hydroxylase-related dioxygenase (phytanoyl-CoA dioxygenase family)